jgi:hypothetical protein
VLPVRVTVKVPLSGPVSEAEASVAAMVTVAAGGATLAMLTVALLGEPTW